MSVSEFDNDFMNWQHQRHVALKPTIKSCIDRHLAHTSRHCCLWVTLEFRKKAVCKLESILTLSKSSASLRRHESSARPGQQISSKCRAWSKPALFPRRSLKENLPASASSPALSNFRISEFCARESDQVKSLRN